MNTTTIYTETPDREQRLNTVLLDYVERLERGETPDRYELLAAYPDLAAELLEFFKGRDQVDQLTAPLREASRSAAELGTLGDFRLLREVGRGGMGVVYEAEQISLRRRVALKVLAFAAAMDPRQLQRFRNEAQAAAHLHHTNIVPVHAVGEERGVHYYAMQFIEGQSLAALLDDLRGDARRESSSGTVPSDHVTAAPPSASTRVAAAATTARPGRRQHFRRAAALVRQAAEALEHAHQMGVVHRDIKPANLLLDRRGELWIADFGLAQFSSDNGLTLTGELLGTLRYASPEQVLAKRGLVDHRTDVYSLGVTLYELLTLTPVFTGRDRQELLHQIAFDEPRPPRSLDTSIPVELETIVLKAVAKHPADRYATAREFADDLQRFLDDRPIHARRPSLLDRATKWARRHRALVVSGIVFLIVAVVVLLVSNLLIAAAQHDAKVAAKKAEAAAKEAEAAADSERREKETARQQRELAERRFRQARRAVDRFAQLTEEELSGKPPVQRAARRFLEAALIYYQEFLDDAGTDPSLKEELTAEHARVTRIVKELASLEWVGRYMLLTERDVQEDLEPTPEQRDKLRDFAARLDEQRKSLFRDFYRSKSAERQQKQVELARENEAIAAGLLTATQRQRLTQIALQQMGPHAFTEPDTVAALKLKPAQFERVRTLHDELGGASMKEWERGPEAHRRLPKLFKETTQKIHDEVLTEDQRERWSALVGKPFTGSLKGPFPGVIQVRPFPGPPPGPPPGGEFNPRPPAP